jgi:hypothetical protein
MSKQFRREQVQMTAKMMSQLAENPAPTLGLDLDGVLDESPIFFRLLTAVWPGKVIIITFREDRAKAKADLAKIGVRYDELVLVDRLDGKAEVIMQMGISVYIDDQPEALRDIPPTVSVMLFRNPGNYDNDDNRWVLSGKTGKLI